MRFSNSTKPFSKLAGIAAALMILPVAVACDPNTADVVDPVDDAAELPETTDETADPTMAEGETIVDVAASNDSFNTLVAAIQAAGLADTLSSGGPFTVFAPTDEAFDALPEGTLDALLLPENQATLIEILNYHVVAGEIPASDVTAGTINSIGDENLDIDTDGGISVNGAAVVQPDVMASNGIIHAIDAVLVPPTVDVSAL